MFAVAIGSDCIRSKVDISPAVPSLWDVLAVYNNNIRRIYISLSLKIHHCCSLSAHINCFKCMQLSTNNADPATGLT